ncbi:DNA cytosine methyltransferase [Streptomyces sp. PSKA54]|uniref:DNA cytosine methyltransferase n=1 Tax=Streptomyces himalayensis subsp. aureolus TaxID=2758039 RepID=A0A7W2D3G0_9ACTN|nr:DNA cytosine methyltransferase [Streptomyces himalayensis]MBA4864036.1 DNA cytosine methyltransferase [Streptomyces himalayensis subsp. aureolus]
MTADAPRLIGSLCSGYGGLDLAVQEVLGGTVAWHADNDPTAAWVLARHWPDVPNLGEITTVDWSFVPQVCVLTAAFPRPRKQPRPSASSTRRSPATTPACPPERPFTTGATSWTTSPTSPSASTPRTASPPGSATALTPTS